MYNRILIASALDQGFSDRALQVAKSLITENGSITAAHVIEPVNNVVQSFVSEEAQSKAYDKIKKMLTERCNDVAIDSEILYGQAGREITQYAEKIGADCIIIGSHKPGLEDFFLGSTSARIVRHSKCAVHVLR